MAFAPPAGGAPPPGPGISGPGQHRQQAARIFGGSTCEVSKVAEDKMNR